MVARVAPISLPPRWRERRSFDAREPIALRQVIRLVGRSTPALLEYVSLKRPEIILRRTRYSGVVIDERLLTSVFPWVPRAPTLQAFLLLSGRMRVETRDGATSIDVRPGEVVLLTPADASLTRYEEVDLIDLEWTPVEPLGGPQLRSLGAVSVARARGLADGLSLELASDSELLADALALFREVGAPLGDRSVDELVGGPSEQDQRIAHAITRQIAELRTTSTALSFGEHADLSPRQIQRILASFCERYRLNATGWRDMRNRYRVQFAIALASIPGIPVSTMADEVGFASPTALARAFANAGLPRPTELRDRLRAR